MNKQSTKNVLKRESIIKLLTDAEVAKVRSLDREFWRGLASRRRG